MRLARNAAEVIGFGGKLVAVRQPKIRRCTPYQNPARTMLGFISVEMPSGAIYHGLRLMVRPKGERWIAMPDVRLYRKALWANADAYVEIWLEKDALAGVVMPVTALYDAQLMVARGDASLSFLHTAVECFNALEVPTFMYHFGDFDPSGVNAGEEIEETLNELAADANITFKRAAVTPEQIAAWHLPIRPTKTSDSRSKIFGDISVELDAVHPSRLRDLVAQVIQLHLPPDEFAVLKAAEKSERTLIGRLVGMIRVGGSA
jgi:hypothetical protein